MFCSLIRPITVLYRMRYTCLLFSLLLILTAVDAEEPWQAKPELIEKFSSRRGNFNYDESKVPAYTLTAPLVSLEGKRVDSAEQWETVRRGELLNLFRDHVYGHRPTTEYAVEFEVEKTIDNVFDGTAVGQSITVAIKKEEKNYTYRFVLFTPKSATKEKPAPAVIHINNRYFVPLDKAIAEHDPFWPVKTLVSRGYATASFHTSDVDPDKKDHFEKGIRGFLAGPEGEQYSDWRALSAWGWAGSRILDHLDTRKEIDSKKVAISGHSRGGKTALWAAAEDPRFAIAYSNNSGCGGAALSRRAYGETVGRITSSFPHWFSNTFSEYTDRENDLPVDQHELISLIAPRGVYIASADEDLWADPRGEYTSLQLASPVFTLLGKESIKEESLPALNQPRVKGATGYHIRTGGHALLQEDWDWFLDFADTILK